MVRPGGPAGNRPVRRFTTAGSDRHDARFLRTVDDGGHNNADPPPRRDKPPAGTHHCTAPIGGLGKSEVVDPRLRLVSGHGVVSPARATGDYQAALSDHHNKPSPGCPIPANRSGAIHPTMEITTKVQLWRYVMVGDERIDGGPRSAIVVGAGIVGLSTAWFLQERGVDVTVVDRTGVAAGASWGNAGWIAPALTLPLNSPAVLRDGLRSLRDPAAPLHIPFTADSRAGGLPGPVRRQLPAIVVETGGAGQRAAERGMHRSLRRAHRQRRRRADDRRPDHCGVSHHRRSGAHDARASPARERRPDTVCHRAIG